MGISTSDGNYHEDPLDFYSAPITDNSEASKSMTHSVPEKGPAQKPLLPAAADALKGFNDTLGDLMTGRVDPASEEGIRKITPITASTMGLGMFGAQTGSLGIFGGMQGMARKAEEYGPRLKKYIDMVAGSSKEYPSNFELHNATGLWEGLEGSPRFHIDASNSKLKLQSDNQLPTVLRETVEKTLGKATDPDKVSLNKETPLHEVLDFPALYEHYPELKNMPVSNSTAYGYHGMYDPAKRSIEMAKATPEDFHSTLIHEVQHAVQHIENHAFGGNPDMFAPKNMDTIKSLMYDKRTALEKEIGERLNLDRNDAYALTLENMDKPPVRFATDQRKKNWAELQKHPDLVEHIKELRQHGEDLGAIQEGMLKMYQKLGGEVESRNAQTWLRDSKSVNHGDIKPFETEDVPREEQILRTTNPEK